MPSLRAVRSTCKLWDALTKEFVLGKAKQFFLGFMTKDSKLCSVRFHLNPRSSKELLDLSVKQVDLLDQIEISRIFHCDGLLLCIPKDHSRLVMWNPYLGQTQRIGFKTDFPIEYCYALCYALGYDINCNHKILRFFYLYGRVAERRYEIYEFSSNSWRVLKLAPGDWEIQTHHDAGVSLKGNTYFYAYDTIHYNFFLLRFDFTTERFGPHLPLPFHSNFGDTVALSCVKEEKLAVLYQEPEGVNYEIVQIWVTTTIEPNYVSWSQFLKVEMKPFALTGIRFAENGGSFFIDEEEKVAVVFDFDGYERKKNRYHRKETHGVSYHMAFVIGEGGYFKSVSLGAARKPVLCTPPLVCSSSYLPR